MKYQKIYKALEMGGAHVCHDASGGYGHPLWIVAEARKQGLRLWASHIGRDFCVSTANMNLPSDSQEYHESYRRYNFHTQTDTAKCLEKLLQMPKESEGAA